MTLAHGGNSPRRVAIAWQKSQRRWTLGTLHRFPVLFGGPTLPFSLQLCEVSKKEGDVNNIDVSPPPSTVGTIFKYTAAVVVFFLIPKNIYLKKRERNVRLRDDLSPPPPPGVRGFGCAVVHSTLLPLSLLTHTTYIHFSKISMKGRSLYTFLKLSRNPP